MNQIAFLNYRSESKESVYVFLDATPTCRPTTSPFLNINTVGIFLTPYLAVNSWLLSTSTLPTTTLP